MEEEQNEVKPRRRRARGPQPQIVLSAKDFSESFREVMAPVLERLNIVPGSRPLDAEGKITVDQGFKSQLEKYHTEPHYWVTFHYVGDDDHVDTEYIGAAGVSYYCRKETPVLLPNSALEALKGAVIQGLDHGHPVEINGRKYLRKINKPRFNYSIDPVVISPEEAAKIRMKQEKAIIEAQ